MRDGDLVVLVFLLGLGMFLTCLVWITVNYRFDNLEQQIAELQASQAASPTPAP